MGTAELDLDLVFSQQAYITNIEGFLKEKDTRKALSYWLGEFEHTRLLKNTDDIVHCIQQSISKIDHMINDQLNLILQNQKFQALEASWRGLWMLSDEADNNKTIKIKVLDISWTEVTRDIQRAMEFDQSQLFQKIYSDEYGTPGGEPYGALIGDYEISHRPSEKHPFDDVSTLQGIAEIAAASFAPFITSASPQLFGMDDFSGLGMPMELENIFSQKEYIKWKSLRNRVDSRFIGLTLPRIMMRHPYRTKPGSYKGLYFYDKPISHSTSHYLWGNASYAFASVLIREFANIGWFGHIRGVPRDQLGGGLLTNLVHDHFETDRDQLINKPLTDVVITDNRERELSNLGFIPLCQCYDTTFAAFYSNQSVQLPAQYKQHKDANTNARLSSMLQHVLCGSRVAHYIKVMVRDKVGSFLNAEDCENYLRNWLFKYTTGREDLEWEEQARYPLREAAVKVKEHPGKPGNYACIIHLRPHYQLDQMVSELELSTELVQKN